MYNSCMEYGRIEELSGHRETRTSGLVGNIEGVWRLRMETRDRLGMSLRGGEQASAMLPMCDWPSRSSVLYSVHRI